MRLMLTPAQLTRFNDHGYIVIEDVLDRVTVLEPLIEEYDELLAQLYKNWVAAGLLIDRPDVKDFEGRLLAAYQAGVDYFQPLDISLPPGDITNDVPFHAGPAIFKVMTDSKLLDLIASVIGPEITSNPIQHVRIKPPMTELDQDEIRAHITSTDWHQDRAVTLEEADATRMVTAWLAITDATTENGCLQVVPGSHHNGMQLHCPTPQLGIPTKFFDSQSAMPLPVKAGGLILFHPLTIHGSLENRTQNFRWSFDLRYNTTGDPTGRPMFPEFVARSASDPDSELRSADDWRRLWVDAREKLAKENPVTIHRWATDAVHCA